MITLIHVSADENNIIVGAKDFKESLYAFGIEPPNYPVPAIPLRVLHPWQWDAEIDWWHSFHTEIVQVTKQWSDGSFTGPTVYKYCHH